MGPQGVQHARRGRRALSEGVHRLHGPRDLGVVRPNLFLTLLAVFSFYTAFSGYRAVARRRVDAKRPDLVGWAMAILTLAASGTHVLLGLSQPTEAWRR